MDSDFTGGCKGTVLRVFVIGVGAEVARGGFDLPTAIPLDITSLDESNLIFYFTVKMATMNILGMCAEMAKEFIISYLKPNIVKL